MKKYRISELFDYEKGSLQSTKSIEGEYNFLTAAQEWKSHNTFTHDTEALVFAAAASGSLGRTHYINEKFIASDLCFILTPKADSDLKLDLEFYHIIFNFVKTDLVKRTKAGTSKEAIGLKNFGKYELPYIPYDEQIILKNRVKEFGLKQILFLNELNKQQTYITKLRQAFLTEAMQGKLVPQDPNDEPASELLKKIKAEKEKLIKENKIKKQKPLPVIKPEEIPYEIPENWVWVRLGEICTKITDGFHNTPPKSKKGFPYISAKHIRIGKIDWKNCDYVNEKYHKELYQKASPNNGELLIVNIGAGCATPAIIDISYEFSFKNVALLKFNKDLVSNKFLEHYFVNQKNNIYMKLTNGGLQPFLSLKILENIIIPFPPLIEQKRIVEKLDKLMQKCDELEASINTSKEQTEQLMEVLLKEALIPQN